MADETPAGNGAATAAAQIKMQVLAQYVRDMSFENMVVQKGLTAGEVQPDIQVAVSLDARKRPVANQYEVITKFKVTSKNKVNGDVLFLLELEYGSTFHIEGVSDEQIHPFLLIECPPERRYGGFHGAVPSGTGAAGASPGSGTGTAGQLRG